MKRLVSFALAVTTALLMIAIAAPSYADGTTFTCSNSGNTTNTVLCTGNDLGNDVANVTITDVQTLSNDQLSFLDNSLDTIAFNILSVNLQSIQISVLNIFNNNFDIPVTVSQINVCVLSNCTS